MGNLNVTGGAYFLNGSAFSSDARLKTDVRDMPYGLREVVQLRSVTFRWKDQNDRPRNPGLIAQEVESVIPDLVVHDLGPAKSLGIDYTGLTAVVVRAVQELAAENATLKQQTQSLELRLAALEQVLERTRARREQR